MDERRERFNDREAPSRRRRLNSRRNDADNYREHAGRPIERVFPRRPPSPPRREPFEDPEVNYRRESGNSYTPLDRYAPYIPPPRGEPFRDPEVNYRRESGNSYTPLDRYAPYIPPPKGEPFRDPEVNYRRESGNSYTPLDPYPSYIPPPNGEPLRDPEVNYRRESGNSYTPLDPYASYIPPPPYFLPTVLRPSSIYGSYPPPPPPPPARTTYGTGPAYPSMTPYSPTYYDQFQDVPEAHPHDLPDEAPDGVRVDFSALQSVRYVSNKSASTLMPSVDAVTLVCANVSRVLYLRTDELQSKAGARTDEIEDTAAELSSFAMLLGNLREVLQSTSRLISTKAFDNMNTLLLFCKKALQKIQSVITTSRRVPSRLNFLKKNSLNSSLSKVKPVRLNLKCLKTSLTAMMSTIVLAGHQHERHEIHSDTRAAASSSETLVNGRDSDRDSDTSRTTYELDAAVERITSKLEDDILANSRAVKKWQEAERSEFNDLYMRNIVPDNASPVSPASQWISALVPFQPIRTNMKMIAGPQLPRAIGYGLAEVVASSSRSQADEDEEQSRIAAVIQVLLTKWTESQPGAAEARKANHENARPASVKSPEHLTGKESENERMQSLEVDEVLDAGATETQDSLPAEKPARKKTKHVSFKDAETEDQHQSNLPNGASTETVHDSGIASKVSDNDLPAISVAEDVPDVEPMKGSAEIGSKDGEGTKVFGVVGVTEGLVNDAAFNETAHANVSPWLTDSRDLQKNKDKEVMYDNAANSVSPSQRGQPGSETSGDAGDFINEDDGLFDGLPKAGWEQADDLRPAPDIPGPRRIPFPYTPYESNPRGLTSDRADYYANSRISHDLDHRASLLPYPSPYDYGLGSANPSPYPSANYYPPPPRPQAVFLTSDEEEPSRDSGFAETIQSSSEAQSRSYSQRSQSDRYRDSDRYPRRNRYSSDSEEESGYPVDNRQALVLRKKSHTVVVQQLEADLKEARAMIERKNAELRNSTAAERMKNLEAELARSLAEQAELQAAAERKEAADERNSARKAEQISNLEASKAVVDARVATLEARLARRDAVLERLKRERDERNSEPPEAPAESPEEEIVEVIEDLDESQSADGAVASARRGRSESSYYTHSIANMGYDTTWVLAWAIILMLGFGFMVSASLAVFLQSDNGIAMQKVLTLMHAQTKDFVVQD